MDVNTASQLYDRLDENVVRLDDEVSERKKLAFFFPSEEEQIFFSKRKISTSQIIKITPYGVLFCCTNCERLAILTFGPDLI